MAKKTRVYQKLFGESGSSGDFGQFGSLAEGSANYTKDPATIQALTAFESGWAAETIGTYRPALEDFNGLDYLIFYQLCYLLEIGIPEWDASTTYYTNSFAQVSGVLYRSLQDSNLNKDPTTQTAWWVLAIPTTASILASVYPVGSIYTATVATNPNTLFGFGTWTAFGAGRVLVGKDTSGTFQTAGSTGGVETVTLTAAQSGVPEHTHTAPGYAGVGAVTTHFSNNTTEASPSSTISSTNANTAAAAAEAHTNLQPYIVVYMWQRTA